MGRKKNMPLIAAVIICVLSIIVMVAALAFSGSNPEKAVFVPPQFDENAVRGTPDVPEGLGWSELDAQVYKVSVCGVVILKDGKADVWFTNSEKNTVWLKLRVLDADGNILGETGLIRPGEYVEFVDFTAIPEEDDPVSLKIMAYEAETYYSAGSVTLNTTITGGNK